MKKHGVIFLLSDLIDPQKAAPQLRLLKTRHDVAVICVSDPVEQLFPLKNPITLEDSETGEIIEYSGKINLLNDQLQRMQEEKKAVCRHAGVDMIDVRCGTDILKPLIGFFSERKKRIR